MLRMCDSWIVKLPSSVTFCITSTINLHPHQLVTLVNSQGAPHPQGKNWHRLTTSIQQSWPWDYAWNGILGLTDRIMAFCFLCFPVNLFQIMKEYCMLLGAYVTGGTCYWLWGVMDRVYECVWQGLWVCLRCIVGIVLEVEGMGSSLVGYSRVEKVMDMALGSCSPKHFPGES